ncbi:MAG: dihydrofolate reductase, partial [Gammaproteobacteria bacterium]|nr:dihydrofolate reductase [Gammaproteobacteria bacterium]
PEIIIMGGAELYQQTLDRAGRIYLTEVHADCTGDTFFPEFNRAAWKEIERQDYQADDRNEYDYSFVVLEKIKPEDQSS